MTNKGERRAVNDAKREVARMHATPAMFNWTSEVDLTIEISYFEILEVL